MTLSYAKKFNNICQKRGQIVTYVYRSTLPEDEWPDPDSPAIEPVQVQHRVFIQPPRVMGFVENLPIGQIDVDKWICISPPHVEYGEDFLHLMWDGSIWTVGPRDPFYMGNELVYKICNVDRQTAGNSGA